MTYPFYIRLCIKLLALGLVIFFLIQARELLIPFTIAIFISFILLPLATKLEQWSLPRWAAAFISVLLGIIVLGGFVYFLYTQLMSFGQDLPELKDRITQKIDSLKHWIGYYFNI